MLKRLNDAGQELLISDALKKARASASSMNTIEGLTDAEIAEAHRSADIFEGVVAMTDPLDRFMKLIHAIDWLGLKDKEDKAAVQAWLDGQFGDPIEIARGRITVEPPAPSQDNLIPSEKPTQGDLMAPASPPAREEVRRFAAILQTALAMIEEERFLNWEVAFPGVWRQWDGERTGGFDAIVGNPPWDRYEFEEVHWFADRSRPVALASSGAARKRLIKKLQTTEPALWDEFQKASERVALGTSIARKSKQYTLLSSGKLNLYKLFVERSFGLLSEQGVCGLLVPSGLAGDLSSAKFFRAVATTGRIKSLFDFENRRSRYDLAPFFPDVDTRFKFSAFICSRVRTFDATLCAFFLQSVSEIEDPSRCFPLAADDFARVNPNTGTAPIFRSRRDAEIARAIYNQLPVLVDRSQPEREPVWPLSYEQMVNMTSDSKLFRNKQELEEMEGAWQVGGNVWESGTGKWLPLYEGKMVQAYDHRAADIVVNPDNQHRPAQPLPATVEQSSDPSWVPDPQYWINRSDVTIISGLEWILGYKDVTAPTNVRTMISTIIPFTGVGNTLPILLPKIPDGSDEHERARMIREFKAKAPLLLSNLNALALDFVARQKVQGQHLNWFIVEQLPVVPPDQFTRAFGPKTAAEIINPAVLELTYTAHDMAPFARDMGHVDDKGDALPPFPWDVDRRLRLRAKLDAVFFHLYGIFNSEKREQSRDDISYIYSTFPIVERQEMKEHGRYLSRDLALAYCNTLAAGQPDAEPEV